MQRIAALSTRLGCSPRAVLLAAARMADDVDLTPARILAELQQPGHSGDCAANGAADLLMIPASAYALGHVESALAQLWRGTDPTAA